MMVLAYEWKKLMIGQRGLACLLAALASRRERGHHGSESRPCRSAGTLLQRPHLG